MARLRSSILNLRRDAHKPITDMRRHNGQPAYYALLSSAQKNSGTPMWRKVSRAIVTAGQETAVGYWKMLSKNVNNPAMRLGAVGVYLGLGFVPGVPDATLRSLAKQMDPSIVMPGDNNALNREVILKLAIPAISRMPQRQATVNFGSASAAAGRPAYAAAVSNHVTTTPPWQASGTAREARMLSLQRHRAITLSNRRAAPANFKSLAELVNARRKR